jgi:hypothetical protein
LLFHPLLWRKAVYSPQTFPFFACWLKSRQIHKYSICLISFPRL